MLDYVAIEPGESLGARGVLWIVVFVIGEIEGIFLAEEGGLRGFRAVYLVHQEL